MAPNVTTKHDQRKGQAGNQLLHKVKLTLVLRQLIKRVARQRSGSASVMIGSIKKRGVKAARRLILNVNNIFVWIAKTKADAEKAKAVTPKKEKGAKKTMTYDKMKDDFMALKRHFKLNDYRLLAECIYSARFLTEGQAKRLINAVCGAVDEEQAQAIKYDALLTDRIKADNQSVLFNIAAIIEAMSAKIEGQPHVPEKISFRYLRPVINETSMQAELKKDDRLVVSPFKLMINDGNYYLLAFDNDSRRMRTYRVERMEEIERTGYAREGEDIFRRIDLKKYAERVFSMNSGRTEQITLCFTNDLLDAVIKRFGTSGASYKKSDDMHFTVTAKVDINDRFFGWLIGFGDQVKIVEPASIASEFTDRLDGIRKLY